MIQAISGPQHRVAFVTEFLEVGGTTTFLCNLAGELVKRNFSTQIWSFRQANPLSRDFQRLNIPVVLGNERKLIFEDRLRLILNDLAKFKPTVVVANLSATSFEVLRYVPPGVFRIGTAQSDDPGVYAQLKYYGGQMDLMAAVSRTIKKKVEGMREYAGVPVLYAPYGVPVPGRTVVRPFKPADPLRILYLGRLVQEQKRVRLFPQILQHLRSSGIPFHWTVAGEGPEMEFLQSEMHSSTPDQTVSFPGKILYGAVPEVLSTHDIFLLASDYEGLPLSLLEGMGAGLVPVVTDLQSGIREVVNENTGKLIRADNIAGYSEAIIGLHGDRNEMRRLATNGRERVEREFSIGAMTDRWLAALPAKTDRTVTWPNNWSIKAPLPAARQFRFSWMGRVLRRLVFGLRSPRRPE